MKRAYGDVVFTEVLWQRPFRLEAVTELLTHLAALTPRSPIVWEARGCQGKVRFYLGTERTYQKKIQEVFTAHGDIQFAEVPQTARAAVCAAARLRISRPTLSLNLGMTEAVVRAGLSALLSTRGNEQTVLQIILGASYTPSPVPHNLPDPHASWLKVAFGNVAPASAESRTVIREKRNSHGFAAIVRLGASGTATTAPAHVRSLLSALRTLQTAGVSIQTMPEHPEQVNTAHIPLHYPLRLSVKELSNLLLLPVGDANLPGVAGLHPKQQLPPPWYRSPDKAHDRSFALSLDGNTRLSISPQDSLEHTHVLGATGSGKSVTLLNLILADIQAGRSVLVIDPKADLVNTVLSRIPKEREDEVVIIDPSAAAPVGFNPMAYNSHNPELIADAIYAVFQEIFKDNFGIRTKDVLTAALLTLTKTEGASLLWLIPLLTDSDFRKKITAGVTDKIALAPYWAGFESLNANERRQETAPILNKIRQFLLRPGLRNVLGQSNPKFNLTELFNKPRIVLVPLNKGLIGSESARLLGSLIVGLTWTLAQSRADIAEERRRLVSVYIDELQDYISLPTDFSDALAQARGFGVGITMAHQYREQLPPDIRAGIDTNARNKIVFGLSATDARSMAAMAPGLEAVDFMTLPRYHVYTSFNQGGRNTGWVSGKTFLPVYTTRRDPNEIRRLVMTRYGKPGTEVEQEYLDLLAQSDTPREETPLGRVGRRKKP